MSQAELTTTRRRPQTADTGYQRRPGATRRLLGSEILMMFRRRRNQALLLVLAIAPIAIGIAVKVSTPHPGSGGPQFLNQVTGNGLFLVFTALTVTVPLLIPLVVGVIAGDSIAGEAGTGTLRYLLTIPVTRSRLLAAKACGVSVFVTAAIVIVAVVGVVAGAILFGLHGPTLLSGQTVSLSNGLARTAEVTGYVILTLTGYIAIGMFISTLTEVPIAAMATTLGVAIVASVLDSVPQLGSVRNVLFVHHWLAFADILRGSVNWSQLDGYLVLQLGYVAVFAAAAWARFVTADITN
jgi:ABC-2 type transport system permease protein